ncbi:MAG: heme-binding domain-containing protein [Chlorobiaceae bacterium]|nr:heme-binding domain-containing protein [Chlorobiaceae bacterium]
MNKRNSNIAGWMVIALMLCQFVPLNRMAPPPRNQPPIPAGVNAVVRRHCYVCHSGDVRLPRSAYIAPLSWYVVREVHQARVALDFSNYQENRPDIMQRIHNIIDSGNITGHACIPGFPKLTMTEQERLLLLEWSN